MELVTILWASGAAFAFALAAVFGWVWLGDRRELAGLMLSLLGVGVATYAYCDLGLMRSTTPAEFGEWHRWNHIPAFLVLAGQVLFVRTYLGTGRVWLIGAILFARCLILVVNFSVHPSFTYSEIVSLGHGSLLGEQVSALGVFVRRSEWQWLATTSLALWTVFLIDAVAQRWLEGGEDSKRKALAVSLGIGGPMLFTTAYSQLAAFGFVSGRAPNVPWMLGALLMMAYELGRDIILSRRERLELAETRSRLAQVERVSLMGQLASALSHELSQPLTATDANVKAGLLLLNAEAPDVEELRAILRDIGSDHRRATEIINRMRKFFTRRTIELRPLRVEDVLQDVGELVGSETKTKNIALHVVTEPRLPRVLGDRVHLTQVLLNLVLNSIQAMQFCAHDARNIVIEARSDDAKGEVEIAVKDAGPGIPPAIAEQLFKPFFTTKPEGTGIGLALSCSIIQAHGGHLWFDETEQRGATFRFTLRRAPCPEPSGSEDSLEEGLYPSSTGERAARGASA
jgi:signal transduction histidine kinase